jgi:hypothetical protein
MSPAAGRDKSLAVNSVVRDAEFVPTYSVTPPASTTSAKKCQLPVAGRFGSSMRGMLR